MAAGFSSAGAGESAAALHHRAGLAVGFAEIAYGNGGGPEQRQLEPNDQLVAQSGGAADALKHEVASIRRHAETMAWILVEIYASGSQVSE
jgi:hypothetical protein